MSKKLLISSAILALSFTSKAQIYSEDFENTASWTNTNSWSTIDADADGKKWGIYDFSTSTNTAFAALGKAAGSLSWDTVALTPNNYFISPAIDLTGITNANLAFKYGAKDLTDFAEHFSVYAITDISSFATISAATALYTETIATGGTIQTKNIDLSSMVGNPEVYLVFRHHSCTNQFVLVIDDVVVSNTSGLNNNSTLESNVYPNPANDVLNINLNKEIASIEILSLEGKILISQEANNNSASVNLSNLNSGMYLYKITSLNGEIITNSFLKK